MKNQISEFLQTRIEAKDFPSAVYLIAEKGEVVFTDALGFAVVEPERIEATIDTIYDLASLTKVLVTGLLCAKLIERGEINLTDKIARYLNEFDTNEKREITIENLLTHTSGFQSWLPFYLLDDFSSFNKETYSDFPDEKINLFVLGKIAETALENLPNSKVTYSDLNFLLLGFLVEKFYRSDLRNTAVTEMFAPLGLIRTFVGGLGTLRKEIAASEFGNEFEKQTCVDLGFDISNYNWRDYQIWSGVHDGNCYFMNGVSGHAGLFSTAFETFKIAQQFLPNQTTLLKPETCELFRTNFTPDFNEARSIGFQLAETKDSTASDALAKDSFGHLGFTGTSLWIEPSSERIFILLTNRTHARELPFANINSVRRRFHELAVEALNER
ncbi:MAG: beta-lactamase family protein [Acidobacteriota bacterium]|nr:beta-lactamase family protein [Acidobacteriota bacterium]